MTDANHAKGSAAERDVAEPIRQRRIDDITTVRYVAIPAGRERANPPSLGDLRKFVAACDGLPDHIHVSIEPSSLDESGRRSVAFFLRFVETRQVDGGNATEAGDA